MSYDLTGEKISFTYGRVVQVVSGSYYDGFGNPLPIGTSSVVITGSTSGFATTGSNTFNGNEIVSGSVIVTNGITGSLQGTSSYSLNTISASYALTASYALNAETATNVSGGTVNVTNITASNISSSTISASNYYGINASFNSITSSGPIYVSGSNAYIQLLPVGNVAIPSNTTASYIYCSGSTNDLYFTQYNGPYTNTTRLRWLESNTYTGILFGGQLSSTLGSTTFNIRSGSGLIVSQNVTTGSDPYPTIKKVDWPDYNNIPIIYSGSATISYISIDNTGSIVQQTDAWGTTNISDWDSRIVLGTVLHLSGSVSTGVFNSPQISYGFPQKNDDFTRAFGPLKISGHTLQASGSTLGIVKTGGTSYREGVNYYIDPNHPSTTTETAVATSKIYRYYTSGSTTIIDTGVNNAGYSVLDNKKYVNLTTGQLVTIGGSGTNQFTIQRVFWVPNSPTNAFIVYYGNGVYGSLLEAKNAIDTEPFTEATNTALNAIFIGYVVMEASATSLTGTGPGNSSFIQQGGLFRSVGGVGASGVPSLPTTLSSLSDVTITSPSYGDLLMYDNSYWYNTKTLSGSYVLSGSLTTNDGLNVVSITASNISASKITGSLYGTSSWANGVISSSYSLTASFALNGGGGGTTLTTGSTYPITSSWSNNTVSASYASTSSYAVTASYALNSLSASYCINPFPISGSLGYWGSFWDTTTQTNASSSNVMRLNNTDPDSNGVSIESGSRIKFAHDGVYNLQFSAVFTSNNASSNDVNVWFSKNGQTLTDSNTILTVAGQSNAVAAWNYVLKLYSNDFIELYWNSLESTMKIEYLPTQSIVIPATPSLIVTATQVTNTQIAPSASYALTASYVVTAQTASYYGGSVTSASYSTTSSYVRNAVSSSYSLSSSYSVSASYAPTNPNITASYLTTTNNYTVNNLSASKITTTGLVNFNSSGSTSFTTDGTLTLSGQNTKGGSALHDFLYVTNTNPSALNPSKHFRLNSDGNFEIINDAYTNHILIVTDSGSVQVPVAQSANVTQLLNTGAGLKIGNYGSIFDDGNFHVHSIAPNGNFWLNASGSGMVVINGQTGATGGVCIGTSIQKGYVTIVGSVNAAITQPYGYLISSGAGSTTGTSPNPYSLTCDNRIMSSEFNVPSDERLKDIKGEISLNKAIDLVTKITPIEFTWKDGVDVGLKAGYSAQQTYKAGFEHLLGIVNRPGLEATTDNDGFTNPKDAQFVMNYEQVIPYHSKLIKHLLDTVEKLEAKIVSLENKLNS